MRCVCGGGGGRGERERQTDTEKLGISAGNLQGVVLINAHQLLRVHDN